MRIALVWPDMKPDHAAGVRGSAFASAWQGSGHEVRCLSAAPPDRCPFDLDTRVDVQALFAAPRGATRLLQSDRRLLRWLRSVDPDIVVVSTPPPMLAWQVARACRRLGLPVVVDVRDLATATLQAVRGRKARDVVLTRMEAKAYQNAQALLTVNDHMASALAADFGLDPERIHVAPNGHGLPRGRFRDPPFSRRAIDVLFIGHFLDRSRGDDAFLAGLAKVRTRRPDVTIAFVGWREDTPHGADFMEAIDRHGIRDCIELIPPLPHRELPRVLDQARVGVMPIIDAPVYRTATGTKVYDYIAGGLPVCGLGPRGGGALADFIRDSRSGTYADTPAGFAQDILAYLTDAGQWRRQAQHNRRIAPRFLRETVAVRVAEDVLVPIAAARGT